MIFIKIYFILRFIFNPATCILQAELQTKKASRFDSEGFCIYDDS